MAQENGEIKFLQQKFENILKKADLGKSSAPEGADFGFANVKQLFKEGSLTIKVKPNENPIQLETGDREYFNNNVYSCLKRAEGTIIRSLGKKRGYSFILPGEYQNCDNQNGSSHYPSDCGQQKSSDSNIVGVVAPQVPRESFLHLPFTIILTDHFEKKSEYPFIWSLQAKSGNIGINSNPDAIMLRKNPRKYRYSTGLEASELPQIKIEALTNKFMPSSLPDLSCASLEFKVFSENASATARKNMMQAITETQLNSSWANESWLVFYMPDKTEPVEIEHDLERFANSLGIGILQVYLRGSGSSELAVHTHINAAQREYIDISPNQSGLYESLSMAVEEYSKYDSQKSTDIEIGSRIFLQGARNLSIQTGFSSKSEEAFKATWNRLHADGFASITNAINDFFSEEFPIEEIEISIKANQSKRIQDEYKTDVILNFVKNANTQVSIPDSEGKRGVQQKKAN
jgi:hypothetical protein